MPALEATETPSRCSEMSGILFLMDFGLTTNISVLPELRRRQCMGHSFLYVFEAGFHSLIEFHNGARFG